MKKTTNTMTDEEFIIKEQGRLLAACDIEMHGLRQRIAKLIPLAEIGRRAIVEKWYEVEDLDFFTDEVTYIFLCCKQQMEYILPTTHANNCIIPILLAQLNSEPITNNE